MATPQVASSGLEGCCCQAASPGQDGIQKQGPIRVLLPASATGSQGLCQGLEEGLRGSRSQQGSSYARLKDLFPSSGRGGQACLQLDGQGLGILTAWVWQLFTLGVTRVSGTFCISDWLAL